VQKYRYPIALKELYTNTMINPIYGPF